MGAAGFIPGQPPSDLHAAEQIVAHDTAGNANVPEPCRCPANLNAVLAEIPDLDVPDPQVVEHRGISQRVVTKNAVSSVVGDASAHDEQILDSDAPGVLDCHTGPGAREDGGPPVPGRANNHWGATSARIVRREAQVACERLRRLEKNAIARLKVSAIDTFDGAPSSPSAGAASRIISIASDKPIGSK
jgi:hypothetical protein